MGVDDAWIMTLLAVFDFDQTLTTGPVGRSDTEESVLVERVFGGQQRLLRLQAVAIQAKADCRETD